VNEINLLQKNKIIEDIVHTRARAHAHAHTHTHTHISTFY